MKVSTQDSFTEIRENMVEMKKSQNWTPTAWSTPVGVLQIPSYHKKCVDCRFPKECLYNGLYLKCKMKKDQYIEYLAIL